MRCEEKTRLCITRCTVGQGRKTREADHVSTGLSARERRDSQGDVKLRGRACRADSSSSSTGGVPALGESAVPQGPASWIHPELTSFIPTP